MKIYTLDEVQDRLVGKVGTPERDKFEYELQMELIGHADSSGSPRKNASLSGARARAVAGELESLGIPAAQITVRGEGSSRPIADNSTPEGRARNRRVEGRLTVQGGAR